MKTPILIAAAIMLMQPAAAHACLTVDNMVSIYPVSKTKADAKKNGGIGSLFKIRYDGQRDGRQDRLWPNYYVVEILEGKHKGKKAGIPAHVTSCHSVVIPKGAEGYVVGALLFADKDGKEYDRPLLRTWMNGRRVGHGLGRLKQPGESKADKEN